MSAPASSSSGPARPPRQSGCCELLEYERDGRIQVIRKYPQMAVITGTPLTRGELDNEPNGSSVCTMTQAERYRHKGTPAPTAAAANVICHLRGMLPELRGSSACPHAVTVRSCAAAATRPWRRRLDISYELRDAPF